MFNKKQYELLRKCSINMNVTPWNDRSFKIDAKPLYSIGLHFNHIEKAHFRGADLRGAVLSDANLPEADLNESDFRAADLCVAILSGATLIELIFTTRTFVTPS